MGQGVYFPPFYVVDTVYLPFYKLLSFRYSVYPEICKNHNHIPPNLRPVRKMSHRDRLNVRQAEHR